MPDVTSGLATKAALGVGAFAGVTALGNGDVREGLRSLFPRAAKAADEVGEGLSTAVLAVGVALTVFVGVETYRALS